MPELPEVEIAARLLDGALRGARVESASAPGINVLKSVAPPLGELVGRRVQGVRRRGKHLIVDFDGGLCLLMHLMSAGRLQLYDRRAAPRDRSSRLLVALRPAAGGGAAGGEGRGGAVSRRAAGGGGHGGPAGSRDEIELRLREFGSRQAAWAKLLRADELDRDAALATLGPEAWPQTPDLGDIAVGARPLNALLRDQRAIAGIGRAWADEILWEARLSPYKRAGDLDAAQRQALREAIGAILGAALAHYERELSLPLPEKLPMPLRVHRHLGEPCPRCGSVLCGVHLQENAIVYCPRCQTGGRRLKDRRLSRLLK